MEMAGEYVLLLTSSFVLNNDLDVDPIYEEEEEQVDSTATITTYQR